MLQYKLRSLGPLGPADWPGSGALYQFNTASTYVVPSFSYYPQGAFAYVGQAGSEYYFQYSGAGVYEPSNPNYANYAPYFHHYGLHEYTLEPWPLNYYFALASESYNIAGLRYDGLAVYLNGSGYAVAPGAGFHTAWTFSSGNLLELARAIEAPVFRVTDYWFGDWNNFPQDTKLPQRRTPAA